MEEKYDYDSEGNRVYRPATTIVEADTKEKVAAGAAGAGVGIVAVIVAIALAVAGWFWFNGKTDTPTSVANDVDKAAGSVYNSTKDVAKEVPQAGKDAVTPGDQSTTRPNADGSKKNLDQK